MADKLKIHHINIFAEGSDAAKGLVWLGKGLYVIGVETYFLAQHVQKYFFLELA